MDFKPISVSQVLKALTDVDHKKSAGPDNLDPYLSKMAADIIAEPISHIDSVSIETEGHTHVSLGENLRVVWFLLMTWP